MTIGNWIRDHRSDYERSLNRVEKTRAMLLGAPPPEASRILRLAYVFSVLSIKTPLERHERAFVEYCTTPGRVSGVKTAADQTVYPNQKADWIRRTISGTDWDGFLQALRIHVSNGRYKILLDAIDDSLIGVSHRKGGFMLAMSGLHEFMCIDSNLANFAGYEESDSGSTLTFNSVEDYMSTCDGIVASVENPYDYPQFLIQWAIYDHERGEHARHMAFYREVLPELLRRKDS